MNVKRFRNVAKVSSILLKIIAVILVLLLSYLFYQVYIVNSDTWFNYSPGFPLFNSVSGPENFQILETTLRSVAGIITPILILIYVYILWKGSQLFTRLSKGEKPFTFEFAYSIKRISILLMITEIVSPILYSLIVTILMEGRHYILLGVGAPFLIGMILYAVSEIFFYGIELQTLSDETV